VCVLRQPNALLCPRVISCLELAGSCVYWPMISDNSLTAGHAVLIAISNCVTLELIFFCTMKLSLLSGKEDCCCYGYLFHYTGHPFTKYCVHIHCIYVQYGWHILV